MTARRSASLIPAQPAISASVRPQPTQRLRLAVEQADIDARRFQGGVCPAAGPGANVGIGGAPGNCRREARTCVSLPRRVPRPECERGWRAENANLCSCLAHAAFRRAISVRHGPLSPPSRYARRPERQLLAGSWARRELRRAPSALFARPAAPHPSRFATPRETSASETRGGIEVCSPLGGGVFAHVIPAESRDSATTRAELAALDTRSRRYDEVCREEC